MRRVTRFDADEEMEGALDEEIVRDLEMLFRHRSQSDLCVLCQGLGTELSD
jgi:hypothetical protein